ncbi:glycosyltransferase [Latilactobacillus sakei]
MRAIFTTIEILVGLIQLVQASYFNDGGRSLKYIAFAPWYILIYWMVNTYTVAVEIIPTIRQIIRGKDAWGLEITETFDRSNRKTRRREFR